MGLEEVDSNSEIPIHSHSEAEEIIFVYGGQGKAYVGDEVADLKPGTVIYLPPNVEHRFVNTGDEPPLDNMDTLTARFRETDPTDRRRFRRHGSL